MKEMDINLKALVLKHPQVPQTQTQAIGSSQRDSPVLPMQSSMPRKEGGPVESCPSPGLAPLAAPRLLLAGWLLPSADWE